MKKESKEGLWFVTKGSVKRDESWWMDGIEEGGRKISCAGLMEEVDFRGKSCVRSSCRHLLMVRGDSGLLHLH